MHTQMVGLYQDPDGKMIFSATNPAQLRRRTSTMASQSSFRCQVKSNNLEVLVLVHIEVTACSIMQFIL